MFNNSMSENVSDLITLIPRKVHASCCALLCVHLHHIRTNKDIGKRGEKKRSNYSNKRREFQR